MSSAPATPRDASTVVLLRDAAGGGFELFLAKRHGKSAFMGGVHVFPGGTLSDEDLSEPMRALVQGGAEAHRWEDITQPERAVALFAAAVRETFEEVGVLVADVPEAAGLPALRRRLLAGEPFASLLAEAGLRLDPGRLVPLSRWITPAFEPRRYDTRFYIALAPPNQRAVLDQHEVVEGAWMSPGQALEASGAGRIRLAPPTIRTLESLKNAKSSERVLELARQRRPPVIEPIIVEEGDELMVVLPGDPLHPEPERAIEGPTRMPLKRRSPSRTS